MQAPRILKAEHRGPVLQSAALTLAATILIGFNWGGWYTSGSVDKRVAAATTATMVADLTPGCTQKIMGDKATLEKLKASSSSWDREKIVREATKTGTGDALNSAVIDACASGVADEMKKQSTASKT